MKAGNKVWVSLFTCLSTRVIYLEITNNLSAEFFINVFCRFVARREKPESVTSDNGKQFVLAKNYYIMFLRKTYSKLLRIQIFLSRIIFVGVS